MNKNDEQILVIPRKELLPEPLHGFVYVSDLPYIMNVMDKIEVKRRGDMEEDPTYKQLISYVIAVDENDNILIYTRLTGGGETRLHGQSSIGVGGHMNPINGKTSQELLEENTLRELKEELGLTPTKLELIGYVNDDTNSVGQVHFGLVYIADVKRSEINITETDTLEIDFVDMDHLPENMETWSSLIAEVIKNG